MNDLDNIKASLISLKPLLVERYHISSIGLFGSIVRNDFKPGKSDIDLIVDFYKPIGIEFIGLAYFLEDRLRYKVDLVSRKGVKPSYFSHIAEEIVYV